MKEFTKFYGFNKQKLYVNDKVRVLTTMLWAEMKGKIKKVNDKLIFESDFSHIKYDLEVVSNRIITIK